MSDLIPTSRAGLQPARSSPRLARSTSRAIGRLQNRTMLRIADVQAEGLVQTEKLSGIDSLAREAMVGQALILGYSTTLAGGDPFVADELRPFADIARLGKAEIIADTIDSYCRESRR